MRARLAALSAGVLAAPLLSAPAYAADAVPSGCPTGSPKVLTLT